MKTPKMLLFVSALALGLICFPYTKIIAAPDTLPPLGTYLELHYRTNAQGQARNIARITVAPTTTSAIVLMDTAGADQHPWQATNAVIATRLTPVLYKVGETNFIRFTN